MKKIRKGDEVIVLAGKDKGKRGKVERVLEDRVVVTGINIAKKTIKPNPMTGATGGIEDKLMPIHVSNVMPYCPNCKKGVRVGHVIENGKKIRVCRKCGKAL